MPLRLVTLVLCLPFIGLAQTYSITSPSKTTAVQFTLNNSGSPEYAVRYKNKPVIRLSPLGFQFQDGQLADGLVEGTRLTAQPPQA